MDQYFISYCETQAAGRAPAPRLCAARGCTWRCFPRGRPRPRFCECTRGTRFRANVFILLGHRATRRIAGLHGASILFYFFRRGSPRLTSQISKTWSAYNPLFFSCFTPTAPILLRFRDQTGSGLLRVAGPQTRCFRFSLLRTRQAASAAAPLTPLWERGRVPVCPRALQRLLSLAVGILATLLGVEWDLIVAVSICISLLTNGCFSCACWPRVCLWGNSDSGP